MTASVAALRDCAPTHLAHYVDAEGRRAFHTYDLQGNPDRLDPTDFLACALLDAPIRGSEVIDMLRPSGPFRCLRDAMQAVLDDAAARSARFEDVPLDDSTGPWSLVWAALVASDSTPGIKASKVTKILHRKRPHLVPIFDSRVAGYYGVTTRRPTAFWSLVQADLAANGDWLRDLAPSYRTPDDRPLSTLRAFDIVVWEHTMGCQASPPPVVALAANGRTP